MWTDVTSSAKPVEDVASSTFAVPRAIGAAMRFRAIVPGVHTPYYFYERI
jgi:hypothetical protein